MRNLAIQLFAPGASLLIVGLAFAALQFGPALFEEPWLRQARAAHAAWTDESTPPPGRTIGSARLLAETRRLGPALHIPDLGAARLRIARVGHVPSEADRQEAIHIGYQGTRRCRLSLWVARAEADAKEALIAHRGHDAYSWGSAGLRYVILASDMADDHLQLIAAASRNMTIDRSGPDKPLSRALRLSAILSRTCDG